MGRSDRGNIWLKIRRAETSGYVGTFLICGSYGCCAGRLLEYRTWVILVWVFEKRNKCTAALRWYFQLLPFSTSAGYNTLWNSESARVSTQCLGRQLEYEEEKGFRNSIGVLWSSFSCSYCVFAFRMIFMSTGKLPHHQCYSWLHLYLVVRRRSTFGHTRIGRT